MKYLFKSLVILLLAASFASASPIMYWGSEGGLSNPYYGDVYDKDGFLVQQGSDWLVELVDYNDENNILFSLTDGFQDGAGVFYAGALNASEWYGLTVKTVIYDNANKAEAQNFAVFTSTYTITWDTSLPVMEIPNYDAGVVSSGQWQVVQAIPEPAVVGFIAIFGGGMLLGRRIFQKA